MVHTKPILLRAGAVVHCHTGAPDERGWDMGVQSWRAEGWTVGGVVSQSERRDHKIMAEELYESCEDG